VKLLLIVASAAVALALGYRYYGRLLARLLRLDDAQPTPAVTLRDDVDYEPIEPRFLLSQHFSAIAAAGPIVGPILAGLYFGWAPALVWIVLGSIFIGGVHDMTALVASIRHRARSIAQVVREHMSPRCHILFLLFIWVALVYIIVAFTDMVASSFVGKKTLDDGSVITGGATATSSLLYLALPIFMGLLLRYTRLGLNAATVIFLPLVGLAIWAGPRIPFDLAALLQLSDASAVKVWDAALLVYCLVAAALPMWLLLQPRGHLGGYFLYVALAGMLLGLVVGGVGSLITGDDSALPVAYPAYTGWTHEKGGSLAPMLFITIACGACSGFHCLIASGTTSKQLSRESDARAIGYGAMLMEGLVATGSLACVITLSASAAQGKNPDLIYALGNARFLSALGIPQSFAVSFALLAFTTFVYDTLDVCSRLGRYVIQELTGWEGRTGKWIGTGATSLVPLFFVTQRMTDAQGNPVPAWRVFWPLFGASNQLLAALSLIGVTVWLHRTRKQKWVWFVVGLPASFMYLTSSWALLNMIARGFRGFDGSLASLPRDPVPWAASVLVALAALLGLEALRVFFTPPADNPPAAPVALAG
jgi:carbon starvation protein